MSEGDSGPGKEDSCTWTHSGGQIFLTGGRKKNVNIFWISFSEICINTESVRQEALQGHLPRLGLSCLALQPRPEQVK